MVIAEAYTGALPYTTIGGWLMAAPSSSLQTVLTTLSRNDKLDRLALLCPSDTIAIELIIDDCLERRWPKARTWLVVRPKDAPTD